MICLCHSLLMRLSIIGTPESYTILFIYLTFKIIREPQFFLRDLEQEIFLISANLIYYPNSRYIYIYVYNFFFFLNKGVLSLKFTTHSTYLTIGKVIQTKFLTIIYIMFKSTLIDYIANKKYIFDEYITSKTNV